MTPTGTAATVWRCSAWGPDMTKQPTRDEYQDAYECVTPRDCGRCDGDGWYEPCTDTDCLCGPMTCDECSGSGRVS